MDSIWEVLAGILIFILILFALVFGLLYWENEQRKEYNKENMVTEVPLYDENDNAD